MATTNTLDRDHSRFLLRLRDMDLDESFDFHLYQGRITNSELSIADSAVVHNAHSYSVLLLSDRELMSDSAWFGINGEPDEKVLLNPISDVPGVSIEDGWCCYQIIFEGERRSVFSMVFGLARIRIALEEGQGLCSLETLDIACACDKDDYKIIVSDMLDELINTQDRECIDWMLFPVRLDKEDVSLVKSAVVDNSAKSLKSLVEMGRVTIRVYKRNLNYFVLHGHCRTAKKEMLVNSDSVRRLGRSELLWLARNSEQLYESNQKTAVSHNEKYYMISRIQTEQIRRSFDNVENRALVSFAGEIPRIFAKAISEVEAYVERFQKIKNELEKLDTDGELLPTLVIVDTCLKYENPIIEEAKLIQREAKNIHERLLKAFPDVLDVRYVLPRRTKVFQEVLPYADIHAEMRKWSAFGRIDVMRDVLALHTWRIDKLFEYYVLYKMLDHLKSIGFSLDDADGSPIRQAKYSIESTDEVFRNEKQVANVYCLARGTEQITLYYQPVFYADDREEHGVDLHRTTRSRKHPYWTPDYLIVHKCGHKTTRVVVDAKFRSEMYVHWNGSRTKGSETRIDLTNSAFLDCILKYKVATCGSNGVGVDGMWVLFGRSDKKRICVYQCSKWACEKFQGIPDGIASLSPKANCLAEMMRKIGVFEKISNAEDKMGSATKQVQGKLNHEMSVRHKATSSEKRPQKSNSEQLDSISKLIEELAVKIYDTELLFDSEYSQRYLGMSHPVLKRKPASGYEAKLYSSQLVKIGELQGYMYTRWLPTNLNKLKQVVRKN